MAKAAQWFSVDKEGLGKLLERRGKEFAIAELISNGWDTEANNVNAKLTKVADSRGLYQIQVEDDDPDGFNDLTHAYTLFAESVKKDKSEKRGRFNFGEKLVLAVCESASILSTKGGVSFDANGRHATSQKRTKGSIFTGLIRMTKDEYDTCVAFVRTLIPPAGVCTVFNGEQLQNRQPKATFEMPLETHIADAEGVLKRSTRKATVRIYEPLADEVPSLYEMGIPVVETNDKWHIDVQQKLPLSFERDNVPPAYLRKLRAEVLNRLYAQITPADAATTWVKAATDAPEAKPEAVNHYLDQVYGQKRVIFDPSDQEANKIAVSQGYGVIYPRQLSSGQWDHVKTNNLALPAGQVTPSHKVNIERALEGSDDSVFLPEAKWTPGLRNIAEFSQKVAKGIGVGQIQVQFTTNITANYNAAYGGKRLIYSVGRLGYQWFEQGVNKAVLSLLIHELAHDRAGDHLSEAYHDALHDMGASVVMLALEQPGIFLLHGAKVPAMVRS
jgi:hypothetical protein